MQRFNDLTSALNDLVNHISGSPHFTDAHAVEISNFNFELPGGKITELPTELLYPVKSALKQLYDPTTILHKEIFAGENDSSQFDVAYKTLVEWPELTPTVYINNSSAINFVLRKGYLNAVLSSNNVHVTYTLPWLVVVTSILQQLMIDRLNKDPNNKILMGSFVCMGMLPYIRVDGIAESNKQFSSPVENITDIWDECALNIDGIIN